MEQKECSGTEELKGTNITLEECFNACKGVSSYMIYGRMEPEVRCITSVQCKCYCEGPYKYGECPIIAHGGYNLYEIHPALEPE